MFKYSFESPQVKQNLISCIANLVYKLPQKLPNDLKRLPHGIFADGRGGGVLMPTQEKKKRLRELWTLGNLEILEKSQILVESTPMSSSSHKN